MPGRPWRPGAPRRQRGRALRRAVQATPPPVASAAAAARLAAARLGRASAATDELLVEFPSHQPRAVGRRRGRPRTALRLRPRQASTEFKSFDVGTAGVTAGRAIGSPGPGHWDTGAGRSLTVTVRRGTGSGGTVRTVA